MKTRARTLVKLVAATIAAPALSFAIIAAPFVHRAHAAPSGSSHRARISEAIPSEREPSLARDAERESLTTPGVEGKPEAVTSPPPARPPHAQPRAPQRTSAPPVVESTFDRAGAQASLAESVESLPICSRGEVDGPGVVDVAFDPNGQVATVRLSGPYAGTQTGACVARRFARATVGPFNGPAVSMRVRFTL